VKEDIGYSSAEFLYGEPLRLPGEFFIENTDSPVSEPSTCVAALAVAMRKLRPVPPREADRPAYVPKDLQSCKRVFVRRDGIRRPLQPPYDGPYDVLHRDSKFFTVRINGSPNNVSIDRLKPAFADAAVNDRQFSLPAISTPADRISTDVVVYDRQFPTAASTPADTIAIHSSPSSTPTERTLTPSQESSPSTTLSPEQQSSQSSPSEASELSSSQLTNTSPLETVPTTHPALSTMTPVRPPASATGTTRFGRRVRFPQKFADFVVFRD